MKWLVRTLTLLWSLGLTAGDDAVICLFSKDCVLPCQSSFQDVIHWQKIDSEKAVNVHSFYGRADQLEYQNRDYKGRTSLFPDQISKGNISLLLRDLRIQDGGRYKCYTSISSNSKETLVTVKVKAPIKSVDIKKTEDGITCSTSQVYPKPQISWTPNDTFTWKLEEDHQGLFSLTSTLQTQTDLKNPKYTCTVSFEDGFQTYTASLGQVEITVDSGQEVTIHCPAAQGENFTLAVTFNGSTILSFDSRTSWPFSTKWKGMDIEINQEATIKLQNPDHEQHVGTYTCERTTAQSRESMQTSVQIKSGTSLAIILGVIGGILLITAAIAIFFTMRWKNKKKEKQAEANEENQANEMQKLTNGTSV